MERIYPLVCRVCNWSYELIAVGIDIKILTICAYFIQSLEIPKCDKEKLCQKTISHVIMSIVKIFRLIK